MIVPVVLAISAAPTLRSKRITRTETSIDMDMDMGKAVLSHLRRLMDNKCKSHRGTLERRACEEG